MSDAAFAENIVAFKGGPKPAPYKHFRKITDGIGVSTLVSQIKAHPDLWDAHPGRVGPNSPHYGIPDIWLRYRDPDELTSPKSFLEPHFPVLYLGWHLLPAAYPIVCGLMAKVRAFHLGGVLITKIPPGKAVKPHHDRGGWHSEFYNCKIYVPLQANEQCVNHCEDESLVMRAGEAWHFDNLKTHSVENNGPTDRMTLIVCMRVEP